MMMMMMKMMNTVYALKEVDRSGALQQPTCDPVANAKRCHILSTAATDQAGGWAAAIARC